jgi:tRNA G26 N,N-dimethylase Trm1
MQECRPYAARVTTTSCASRWRLAQLNTTAIDAMMRCRTCEAGKRNATGTAPRDASRMRECKACGDSFVVTKPAWVAQTCSRECWENVRAVSQSKWNKASCERIKKSREAKKAVGV